jgi:leucyl aminopeptidase
MPLFEEYKEQLKSEIADMLNSPGRPAGSITAAMFLKEFAGEGRGPSRHRRHRVGGRKQAVAAERARPAPMIRTLIEVARGGFAG